MDYTSLAQSLGGTVAPTQVSAPIQNSSVDYGAMASELGGTVQPPQTNTNPLSAAFDLWSQHANNVAQGVANTIKNAWDNSVQTFKNTGNNATNEQELTAPLHYAGNAFSALLAPFAGVAQLLGVDKPINAGVQALSSMQVNNALPTLNAMNDYFDAHPDVKQAVLQDIPNILNGATLFAGGGEAAKTSLDTPTPDNTVPPVNPPALRTPDETAQLQSVATDWQKPTQENTAGFNKARAVLAKDPEIPQYLAEHGLNPYTHIENGVYVTEDAAQSLRDDMGQLSRDGLRPALQQADYVTPPTPVADLPRPDISKVDFAVTAGDTEKVQANIDSELAALEKKYPDGMNLEQKLDEKIVYDKNGGYSPIKDAAQNNKAIANRAIANSLRDSLSATAPKDIPVDDFQAELSKGYRAADYLDTLQGKKAPVSIGQKIARYTAKIVGAKVAGMVGGGDLVSEFAGYHVGAALEHMVENLTNPMRDQFLKSLKIANPEAFKRVANYIGQQEAERATQLALPEPAKLGTERNPIITPAPVPPTTYEAPAQIINRVKSLPGKTIFDMMSKAQQKEIIQKFLNEPYIAPDKLPIIK